MIFFNLREKIRLTPAKRDKFFIVNLVVGLLINLVVWLLVIFKFHNATDLVILKYNVYFGISWLGEWWWLLGLPLIGLVVIFIDYLLAAVLYLNYIIISYFLVFAATLTNALILFVSILLIYINL